VRIRGADSMNDSGTVFSVSLTFSINTRISMHVLVVGDACWVVQQKLT